MKKWGMGCLAVELLLVIAAVVAVALWRDADLHQPPPSGVSPSPLHSLTVAEPAPWAPYSRDEFGQKWSDDVTVELGHNGCDTRNDILARDLSDVVFKPGTRDCVVLSGWFVDPFSGETVSFQRGQDTSPLVQIDHTVALFDAWTTGAQDWSADKRRDFANDPRNLMAVSGALNQQKSAANAADWLPPNRNFHCDYASRIVEVKHAYGLWVTPDEFDALEGALQTC